MKLTVLAVGKVKRSFFREGCDEYASRIGRYLRFEVVEVKDEPPRGGRTTAEVREKEAERIRQRLPPGARVIALDERGDSPTSEAFAAELGALRDRGLKDLVFVVGGPLGLEPTFRAACERQLALSSFTLPHELARLTLLEQLYRACTLLAGEPYHNP